MTSLNHGCLVYANALQAMDWVNQTSRSRIAFLSLPVGNNKNHRSKTKSSTDAPNETHRPQNESENDCQVYANT